MEIALIIIAVILSLLGIVGSVIPALPGPPLSWIGLLLMRFAVGEAVSTTLLIVTGTIMVAITLLDYFAPVWFTGLGGGSKAATRGSMIGLIAGLFFFPPIGMIIGPIAGAFAGELMTKSTPGKAFGVAMLSLLSFLLTTGIKLIYTFVAAFYIVKFIFV